MRFKRYVCTSPEAKIDVWNQQGCLYEGFLDRESNKCIYCGIDFEETRTIWDKLAMLFPYWVRQNPLQSLMRSIKFFWQRRTRGFDDSELWSLDYTCAKLMAPRIRAFIDQYGGRSVPCDMDENISFEDRSKAWVEILEKIYRAFKLTVDSDGATYILTEEEQKAIEEGLDLFRARHNDLWD